MLSTLLGYKRWANSGLLDSLLKVHASAPAEPAHDMLLLLNHVYVVEQILQVHLLGKPNGYTALNTEDTPSLLALRQRCNNSTTGTSSMLPAWPSRLRKSAWNLTTSMAKLPA